VKRHGYKLGYTVTKVHLHRAGLVRPALKRSAHRKKRPRRPMVGMLLHQDASKHAWLPGDARLYDLVVTLDDATSAIYSAFLVGEEGTASSFRGLAEVIAREGLFCALYTDRAGHYFHTPKAGGAVDRKRLIQVGRALAQLGIEHIAAYSPEARGRSERMFGTLQDRLVRELADAGIETMAAANRFIAETYLPAHNRAFMVEASEAGTAFLPWTGGRIDEILCQQEERVVDRDNTVSFQRRKLQIEPSPIRRHFVRATVTVKRYADASLGVFYGPRCIGRYGPDGKALSIAA